MAKLNLTPEAQSAVERAYQIAQRYRHVEVDDLHLMVGVLQILEQAHARETSDEKKTLATQVEKVKALFEADMRSTAEFAEPSEAYLRVMLRAQQVAESEQATALDLPHIYMAIIDQNVALAGAFDEAARRAVETLFKTVARQPAGPVPAGRPVLAEFGRDLTELARQGKLNLVFGRDAETRQLVEALLRRGKNSVVLLGPAGVGKTAVVEKLAQDIVAGMVPEKLRQVALVEINLPSLLAGTVYRGQFEERLQGLIREASAVAGEVILVFDEFHTIMGAGAGVEGGLDAANMLKPAVARGEICCIGITTNEEYARHIEKDAALARRFQAVQVAEPSPDETLQILCSLAPAYAAHHHVEIPEDSLQAVVRWSEQFLPARRFPDKAIDVLAKSAVKAEIGGQAVVSRQRVAGVISEMAGVPVGDLEDGLRQTLAGLEQALSARVIGQPDAVSVVSKALRLAYTGVRDPRRPKGVFLFAGPSGVGKTELARSLAVALFGSERALVRLDMSEYGDKASMARLIGAPPGYIGYEQPGQLAEALRQHPHAVVLFDEVEKAHAEVFDLFLQLFDEGRITDSQGRAADGRNAIFVMTSNLGAVKSASPGLGFLARSVQAAAAGVDLDAVRSFFRPELINRVDHVVAFRPLDLDDLAEIAGLELARIASRLAEQQIRLTYESGVAVWLAEQAQRQRGGARGLKALVEKLAGEPISERLIARQDRSQHWIHLQIYKDEIEMEWV